MVKFVMMAFAFVAIVGCGGATGQASNQSEPAAATAVPTSTRPTETAPVTSATSGASPVSSAPTSSLAPTTTGSGAFTVVHPIGELDHVWASQPYATQDNAVGIQFHNGIDYFVTESETTVVAAISGQVMDVRVTERQPDGAFQVNLMIMSASGPVLFYSLEPSAGPADAAKIAEQATLAEQMLDRLTVGAGDQVTAGQTLGVLLGQDEWAHVHMTLKESNGQPEVWLCPVEFMSDADAEILTPLTEVWADRLYGGSTQPELCNR